MASNDSMAACNHPCLKMPIYGIAKMPLNKPN